MANRMAENMTNHDEAAQVPATADAEVVLDALDVSPASNLISVLQDVQDKLGYLPATTLEAICLRTRIPLSRVYGVVTFYTQFYTEPRGRHTVRVCRGTACYVRGGKTVLNSVKRELGIEDGETTEDMMFTLETVACLGACALAPLMVVDSTYHGKMDSRKALRTLMMCRKDSIE